MREVRNGKAQVRTALIGSDTGAGGCSVPWARICISKTQNGMVRASSAHQNEAVKAGKCNRRSTASAHARSPNHTSYSHEIGQDACVRIRRPSKTGEGTRT